MHSKLAEILKEKQKEALHSLIEWQVFTTKELYKYKKFTMPAKTEIDDFVDVLKEILTLERLD